MLLVILQHFFVGHAILKLLILYLLLDDTACVPFNYFYHDKHLFSIRFGVCCLFLASNSGSVISQNCTYVRNPEFPGNYNGLGSVAYKLIKPADGEK